MKERPILFRANMAKAILEGRKTQTRRIIKPQPIPAGAPHHAMFAEKSHDWFWWKGERLQFRGDFLINLCPYGNVGDRLWVRETCNIATDKSAVMYVDSGGKLAPSAPAGSEDWAREWVTKPSIFMPRWASRITLEIVLVRVERLDDISEDDAVAEGFNRPTTLYADEPLSEQLAHLRFRRFFRDFRKMPDDVNPWLWVIEFKRVE